jgi:hypothetical protein
MIAIPVRKKAVIFIAATLLASAIGGAAAARMQDFQAQTCYASDAGATFAAPIYSWSKKTPQTWSVLQFWQDVYDCGSGMLSACSMCYLVEFNYLGAGGWVSLNQSITSSGTTDCGTQTTLSFATSFPSAGVLTAGTMYQIVYNDTAWDGAFSGCGANVQHYAPIYTLQFADPGPPTGY